MSLRTLEAVIRWQRDSDNGGPLEITFHGGEPLVSGASFYHMALPFLREGLAPRKVRFSIQSNLWLLSEELCEIFKEQEVSLGTSLDGPEPINDAQRGPGYFEKTMAGIERARSNGLAVGCICTFTAQSAKRAGDVFDFFLREGLGFGIHAALPPLDHSADGYALSPKDYGRLLVYLLDRYLDESSWIRIGTLDAMCRSISAGKGGICTFSDCLGNYLAVDPDGWIYPCQRFAGGEAFRLGNVYDHPTREDFEKVATWRNFLERQKRIEESCRHCSHLDYCRGGCPYNVLAANAGSLEGDPRDPHCPAYRRVFDEIIERALGQVFSEENMAAIVDRRSGKKSLLRKGKLIQMMSGDPHPKQVAGRARQAVAAAALAVCSTPEEALQRLDRAGVITNPVQALGSLRALRLRLDTQSSHNLLNAYIHVTSGCNLSCRHCYASSRGLEDAKNMAVENVVHIIRQTAEAGFKKAVITGGEPLVHPRREELLSVLAVLRREAKPMQLVLRTNLACFLDLQLLEGLLSAADEIVVSVDGDRESHDAQRGAGTYGRTVEHLRVLHEHGALRNTDLHGTEGSAARIIIAATLNPIQIQGPEGDAVRALGEELNLQVRFKPVLPLGRGASLGTIPAFYSSLDEDAEAVAQGARVASTCGLGMNLSIGPDDDCYPCYALMSPRHFLGNASRESLAQVLSRNDSYRKATVDSNRRCRDCSLRYLCGGFCRAWRASDDPDEPPSDCKALYRRAERILNTALEVLEIGEEKWREAGLRLPG